MRLLRLLVDGGHEAVGLIRKPEQAADVEAFGAEALVCDLEAADDVRLDGDEPIEETLSRLGG